jgi:hypothetical protein
MMAGNMHDFPEVFTFRNVDGKEVWSQKTQISIEEMERLCTDHPDFYRCEQRGGRRVMILTGYEDDRYYVERPTQCTDETKPRTVMEMWIIPQGLSICL